MEKKSDPKKKNGALKMGSDMESSSSSSSSSSDSSSSDDSDDDEPENIEDLFNKLQKKKETEDVSVSLFFK